MTSRAPPIFVLTSKTRVIGIDPEKQAMVFESFRQADGSTSRKYGGTGLGLTITKQLVELLKGSISLVSEKEIGLDFHPADPGRCE